MSKPMLNPSAKKAFVLGGLCSVSYLAVYIARNILGAVSPAMIDSGVFSTETIGTLSSIYFVAYAIGQLINGILGDKIKSKYMIGFGLILAGICNLAFSLFSYCWQACFTAYALTGFFLSMIYAPMTKVVSENTEPVYATRCSLGYTFSSFFGSPLAGLLASAMVWQSVFFASSSILIAMGCIIIVIFTVLEKKKVIEYGKYKKETKKGSVAVLIRHGIIKFTLISILTGVIRTTVIFWLPTYISQYLGYSADTSALIFTVATLIISASAFISVFLYERLNRNMELTILISFSASAICFMAAYLVKAPVFNIICIIFAILSSNSASSMMWSRYCPSLRDTGMVSSATGYLDFVSYISAAISSTLFSNSVDSVGWKGLILIWFALMALGVVITAIKPNRKTSD